MPRRKVKYDLVALLAVSTAQTPADPRFKNLVTMTFGRLTVVRYLGKIGPQNHKYWECRCSCGERCVSTTSQLMAGRAESCGCLHVERTVASSLVHGMTGSVEFSAWQNMLRRCYEEKNRYFSTYGGRGVTVCDRWRYGEGGKSAFQCFLNDLGLRPTATHSIDRYPDFDGNYEPGNVRWATPVEQQRNRRNNIRFADGTVAADDAGLPVSVLTFTKRLARGWTEEEARTLPAGTRVRHV